MSRLVRSNPKEKAALWIDPIHAVQIDRSTKKKGAIA